MNYPVELTTSDWVDGLKGLSRDDQITMLATYHRRIDAAARRDTLANLTHPDEKVNEAVRVAADVAMKALPVVGDYAANG